MTAIETILSGCLLSFISGWIGVYIGKSGKMSEEMCDEHRSSCSKLVCQKIDFLSSRIDELRKAVDGKLLGI